MLYFEVQTVIGNETMQFRLSKLHRRCKLLCDCATPAVWPAKRICVFEKRL